MFVDLLHKLRFLLGDQRLGAILRWFPFLSGEWLLRGPYGPAGQEQVLFDAEYYASRYPDVPRRWSLALAHYLAFGAKEWRDPQWFFSTSFYLHRYPDVRASGQNPLVHFARAGAFEGRDPHPLFQTRYYLERNRGAISAGVNPLIHYLLRGWKEGRSPTPLFDSAWYLASYPDVERDGRNPLLDYWEQGLAEGRNPNAFFDTRYYAARYAEALSGGQHPLIHYLHEGGYKGCDPSPGFSSSFYLEANPDVAAAGINPLVHFLWIGREQEREPLAKTDIADRSHPAPTQPRVISSQYAPLVSVVMPTHNTPAGVLRLAIESVRAQTYTNWELCLVDDGSARADTIALVDALPKDDPRWKVRRLPENQGISRATNAALEMARGDLVAFLDHDDELAPDALMEVVAEWSVHRDTDAVYTDQQTMNETGQPVWAFHKPDWSPEFFRGVMHAGHLLVIRRSCVEDVGGCDPAFDTIQDYELLLRISERTQRIRHVRRVLYSWRQVPGSVAAGPSEKPGIDRLQRAAVQAHLHRVGLAANAVSHPRHPHRVVLIPQSEPDVRVVEASSCDDLDGVEDRAAVLFCAPGVAVAEDALAPLLLYAMQPDVGCVSPLLLRPDGRVHNAGLGVVENGGIRYCCSGWSPEFDGYAGELSCAREVSLVSGHVLLISARGLRLLHRSGESYRTPLYRGCDLSLRARSAGLRNLCVPSVTAAAAAPDDSGAEDTDRARFLRSWASELHRPDPYWHDGFRHASHLRVEEAERVWKLEATLR